jgi:predicted nucleic acid-binding protein
VSGTVDPGTLIDTNVLIDVLTRNPLWSGWSRTALSEAADLGELVINPIIYAELASGFARIEDLDAAVPPDVYRRVALPWPAAFLASRAFLARHSARGGERRTPLPDFLIGAHAAIAGMRLLTRDPRPYRSNFPGVELISPQP